MIVKIQEFVGALKAALLFANVDTTRPSQNCVHVEAVGAALRLVATDGHTMWCCEVPARETVSDPPPVNQVPWNVRRDDVEKILASLKGATGDVEVLLVKRTVAGVEYPQHSEHFSPYAAVIPPLALMAGKIPPEFATDYVERCCQAFALYGKGFAPELPKTGTKSEKETARFQRSRFVTPPIAWLTSGEYDPAIFYSPKFPAALAIVMPRRGEGAKKPVIESFVDRVRRGEKVKAA